MSEIIQLDKKSYHIGLIWRSFEDRIKATELREVAADIEQCEGAYWTTDGLRYIWGFATTPKSGQKYTKCSGNKCSLLALELASRAELLPFAFILKNKDSHSFVVVDENRTPLPGSDRWYTEEASMHDALSPYVEIFTAPSERPRVLRLTLDSNLIQSDSDQWESLERYLQKPVQFNFKATHYVSLIPKSYRSLIYTSSFFVIIGLIGYAGYNWYTQHEKPLTSIANNVTGWHPPVTNFKPPKPKISTVVAPDSFLNKCSVLSQLPLSLSGYNLISASCSQTAGNPLLQLNSTYRMPPGMHPLVIPANQTWNSWTVTVSPFGSTLSLSKKIRIKQSQTITPEDLDSPLLEQRTWGTNKNIQIVHGVQANALTLKSTLGLSSFYSILRNMPVQVSRLSWNGKNSWELQIGSSRPTTNSLNPTRPILSRPFSENSQPRPISPPTRLPTAPNMPTAPGMTP